VRTLIWTTLLAIALPVTAAVVRAEDESSPAAADATAIEALIQQLSADDFQAREAASKKLAALGKAAQPALEKAVKESKSPEARWRADQLLQKLKGVAEKPLGAESGPPGESGTETPPPAGDPQDPLAALRKMMEEFRKRGSNAFAGGIPGLLNTRRRIEAPGLVLEHVRAGQVQLKVEREREENQAPVVDAYFGRSLSDILEQHPDLLKHPGMEALKRQDAKQSWPGQEFFKNGMPGIRVHPFPGGQGFGITTSSGVSISQGADGVTVKITERGEDGKETTKEYKGESLEQIKKEHPEIADKLGGFGVHFRVAAPDFFWPGGQRKSRLEPLDPTTPRVRPLTPGSPRFGVGLQRPDEALASQLRLAAGTGAVVRDVTPGSQAHELGVERHDLILKINGESVTLETAVRALRTAAAERGTLKIELVRGGKPRTLER